LTITAVGVRKFTLSHSHPQNDKRSMTFWLASAEILAQEMTETKNYQIFIFAFCEICSRDVERLSMAFPFQFVVQIS
jgi:hypothetical protein